MLTLQTTMLILGAFIGTLLALYLANHIAPRIGLVDHPDDDRKLHVGQIPLTGGSAIVIGLLPAIWLLAPDGGQLGLPGDFLYILSILVVTLVIAHAIDDIKELSAYVRLAIDATLALLISTLALISITNLGDLFGTGTITLGRWSVLMTLFSFIAASNAYNMTDGIDGLCSSLGILSCVTLILMFAFTPEPIAAILIQLLTLVIAALVAAYIANLGYLGRHMKAFLGDSGARLIGFIIAMFVIYAAEKGLIRPVLVYFPMAIPVSDCLVLMATRIAQSRSPFSADRLHLHHLLQDLGFSQTHTRFLILLLGSVFSGIGLMLHVSQPAEWICSVIVVSLFAAYIVFRLFLQYRIAHNKQALTAISGQPD